MKIRKQNIPAHMDIESMLNLDGQHTLTLRINAGNIVDLTKIEYVDTRKGFGDIEQNPREAFEISSSAGKRDSGDAVRNDNNNSIFGGGNFNQHKHDKEQKKKV